MSGPPGIEGRKVRVPGASLNAHIADVASSLQGTELPASPS